MTYDAGFSQRDLMALFDLKGSGADIADWCGDALPPLPSAPRTLTRDGDTELMWLAPEHWILRAPIGSETDLVARLRPDAAPLHVSVVRISDTLVFFALTGPDLDEALSVITSLDTHPGRFPADSATFTEALGIKALIIRTMRGMEIGVDRSFAPMVADYLTRIGLRPL